MRIRALTGAGAATIAAWRYAGKYSTYDVTDPSDLATDHWAVTEGGELVGYCCFGAAARVAAAEPAVGTLDIGYGMKPELMGRGRGLRFVAAILEFALRRHDPQRLRLYVLEWNERSRKVASAHGFVVESELRSGDELFLVMVRSARDRVAGATRA